MQNKTTLRFHLTPVRMATIKNSGDCKCCRGCGERRTLLNCSGGTARWYNHSGIQSGGSSEYWTYYYQKIQQYLSRVYTQKMFQLIIRTHATSIPVVNRVTGQTPGHSPEVKCSQKISLLELWHPV